ncbi:uncharacterized protein LOC108674284 [Hyalella azteca]|uniref:Small RNA 2'-O-methyltransferase n=1 Tax=Hyalella azteca TaxID=294128 RepID=A0A8B7NVF6_HYAAZ|nr:uncharacterized protein LOC108674284 [Hyalella azteca]
MEETQEKKCNLDNGNQVECVKLVDEEHMNCVTTLCPDGTVRFKPCLNIVRFNTVESYIRSLLFCGVNLSKVVDYGCGDKRFLTQSLLKMPCLTEIVCVDKNLRHLVREKLMWQESTDRRALTVRVRLIEADVLDLPEPVASPHVVTLIEVIEHFHIHQLPSLLWGIFGVLKPKIVILTTPNTDFHTDHPLPDGKKFRDPDHKFEWTNAEFRRICVGITSIYTSYCVAFDGCGVGKSPGVYCSQIAIFAYDEVLFNKGQLARCTQPTVKSILNQVSDAQADKANLLKQSSIENSANLSHKKQWRDKKQARLSELPPARTSNERAIDAVLAVVRNIEMMPGKSSLKAPVMPEDWSKWSSVSAELKTPDILLPEPEEAPSTERFLSNKFNIVLDLTYLNVFAQFFNEMKYNISCFSWCLSSQNTHNPFINKVQRLTVEWNYLDLVSVHLTDPTYYLIFLKLVTPRQAPVSLQCSSGLRYYDDEDDGACHPSHRTYKKHCKQCPFIYFKRVTLDRLDEVPKLVDTQASYQSHVIYEKSDTTKIFFSFALLRKFLDYRKDDGFVRTALSDLSYERLFVGEHEYWSCCFPDLSDDESSIVDNSSCIISSTTATDATEYSTTTNAAPEVNRNKFSTTEDTLSRFRGVTGDVSDLTFANEVGRVACPYFSEKDAGNKCPDDSPMALIAALQRASPFADVAFSGTQNRCS